MLQPISCWPMKGSKPQVFQRHLSCQQLVGSAEFMIFARVILLEKLCEMIKKASEKSPSRAFSTFLIHHNVQMSGDMWWERRSSFEQIRSTVNLLGMPVWKGAPLFSCCSALAVLLQTVQVNRTPSAHKTQGQTDTCCQEEQSYNWQALTLP